MKEIQLISSIPHTLLYLFISQQYISTESNHYVVNEVIPTPIATTPKRKVAFTVEDYLKV